MRQFLHSGFQYLSLVAGTGADACIVTQMAHSLTHGVCAGQRVPHCAGPGQADCTGLDYVPW